MRKCSIEVARQFKDIREELNSKDIMTAYRKGKELKPKMAEMEKKLQLVNDAQQRLEDAQTENESAHRGEMKTFLFYRDVSQYSHCGCSHALRL